jgi:hypothetical protein
MKRTQVYFPEDTLEIIKKEAREKETTMAAVIREKVEEKINEPSEEEVKKALKAVDELSKIGLPTGSWEEMEKIIMEGKDPLHFERKRKTEAEATYFRKK